MNNQSEIQAGDWVKVLKDPTCSKNVGKEGLVTSSSFHKSSFVVVDIDDEELLYLPSELKVLSTRLK